MYDYLKGQLVRVRPQTITIDVNGVGYLVHMANPFQLSNNLNEECLIFIHHALREDDESLYGFVDEESRRLFELLLSVSGIGAKSALAILASEHVAGFVEAVESENQKFLTKFPGVGKKTAAQIILDLKGKLTLPEKAQEVNKGNEALERANEALRSLGYSVREIEAIQARLEKEAMSGAETELLLKMAFKLLLDR
ncbi:Holliday junction branch migration protein RuvA [Atopobacter sp. AH10]|nr:Holliday junction branch migration protein RuvA [Atopobacter sp. AH10]